MKSKYWLIYIWFLPVLLLTGCGVGQQGIFGMDESGDQVYRDADVAMGTVVQQTIYVDNTCDNDKITDDIFVKIDQLEGELLSRRLEGSEIATINQNSGIKQEISLELAKILEECLQVSKASEGAFDVSLGKLILLWDIDSWTRDSDGEFVVPSQQQIEAALADSGYEYLELEDDTFYMPEGHTLDLGAVGKGLALDALGDMLQEQKGVTAATISLGGSVLTYGSKPDGSPWCVGIVNPFDTQEQLGYLELSGDWCVSTSGDYERFVEAEGRRYHHIMDPATGYPVENDVKSVTILSKSGLLSDALSTACYVLGVEKGMELAKYFSAEALFVTTDEEISMTEGMYSRFFPGNHMMDINVAEE